MEHVFHTIYLLGRQLHLKKSSVFVFFASRSATLSYLCIPNRRQVLPVAGLVFWHHSPTLLFSLLHLILISWYGSFKRASVLSWLPSNLHHISKNDKYIRKDFLLLKIRKERGKKYQPNELEFAREASKFVLLWIQTGTLGASYLHYFIGWLVIKNVSKKKKSMEEDLHPTPILAHLNTEALERCRIL